MPESTIQETYFSFMNQQLRSAAFPSLGIFLASPDKKRHSLLTKNVTSAQTDKKRHIPHKSAWHGNCWHTSCFILSASIPDLNENDSFYHSLSRPDPGIRIILIRSTIQYPESKYESFAFSSPGGEDLFRGAESALSYRTFPIFLNFPKFFPELQEFSRTPGTPGIPGIFKKKKFQEKKIPENPESPGAATCQIGR